MKKIYKILTLSTLLLLPLHAEVTHFKTLDNAVNTFIDALQNNDKQVLEELFTEKYKLVVDQKDIDKESVTLFLDKFKDSHGLMTHDDKEIYISVGKLGWTFPIPLVESRKGWYYDINVGLENIKTREIGRNEIALIEALHAGIEVEILKESTLADSYLFLTPHEETLDVVALPKEYGTSAIMSFVRAKDGKVYEADLKEKVFTFSDAFKLVQDEHLIKED